jgi:type I restriction enzyme S subunit
MVDFDELWLSEVPAQWELRRLKSLFVERVVKGFPDFPLLAATQTKGVVTKEEYGLRTVIAQSGLENLKLVEPGDFVISLRSFEGGIEISHACGIISPAYTVLRVVDAGMRGFFRYLFKSRYFLDAIRLTVTGIREGQNIDYARLGRTLVALPDPDEQELIVRYLDHAELRIAKAIAAKQAVVNLMQEARQSLVSEIVATGLKRDVELRDSEVPGLGLIPANWRTLRAKHVWRSIDVRSKTGTEERLTVSSSSGIVPRSTKNVTMFEAASYVGHKVVQVDDLVINSLWAWAGGLGVSDHVGLVSPVYGVYRLREGAQCDPHFMHNLLRSNVCQWQFQVRSKGIWKSRLSLTDEAFFEMVLPIPPIEEQEQITEAIRFRTADLNRATEPVLQEIALLKEYRTRLISDVVTGKLDVREEAAKLPVIDPEELAEVTAGAELTAEDDGDDE